MGLQRGPNSVAFATAGSNQMVSAKIFLWDTNEKIIVTDIDGTITRYIKKEREERREE
jgi:phosphatidate phosphatase LPIN